MTELEGRLRDAYRRGSIVDLSSSVGRTRVDAHVLREVLRTPEDELEVGAALHLRGARIVGTLEMGGLRVTAPVAFDSCTFSDGVVLRDAQLDDIRFRGVRLRGVDARNLHLDRGFAFTEGSVSTASLDLLDAEIGGHLVLTRSRIETERGAVAVELGRARVEWRVALAEMHVVGTTRLVATRIGGTLSLSDTHLDAGTGIAFHGERLQVGESLFMQRALIDGLFSLLNARVDGGVEALRAHFHRPGRTAVSARRLVVGRNFGATKACFLGSARFENARVAGALSFSEASFVGPSTTVLARHSRVGQVRLNFALAPALLDLAHAEVDVVEDEPRCWPATIELAYCSYRTIASRQGLEAEDRLRWLKRSSDSTYRPGTFAQLIKLYENMGDNRSMRITALAAQRERRKSLSPGGRAAGYFLDASVGYGYRNGQALLWMLMFLLVGGVAFSVFPAAPTTAAAVNGASHFNAWMFSLDELLPVVDLGQKKNWEARAPIEWLGWVLVLAGWALTTAVVAGFTRFLSKK